MGCLPARHEISGLKHPLGMESSLKYAGKLRLASQNRKRGKGLLSPNDKAACAEALREVKESKLLCNNTY